jgi:hypothetical protein
MDPYYVVIWVAIFGAFVGLLLWLVPMPPIFKQIILVVSVFGVFFWLLEGFGLFSIRSHLRP